MPLSRFLLNSLNFKSLIAAGLIFLCLIMADFGPKTKGNPKKHTFFKSQVAFFLDG